MCRASGHGVRFHTVRAPHEAIPRHAKSNRGAPGVRVQGFGFRGSRSHTLVREREREIEREREREQEGEREWVYPATQLLGFGCRGDLLSRVAS